jgi:enoyl-CoA hydratase/carnithine racemase
VRVVVFAARARCSRRDGPERPARLSESPSDLREYRRPILQWWNLLEEMPKPTICQIHGAALGGAFELALRCDFRTMAEDAVAGIMEVAVGLLPDVGGCSRLRPWSGSATRRS